MMSSFVKVLTLMTYMVFLFFSWSQVRVCSVVLCPTLCDPVDCSLPGSSVHGISQARMNIYSILHSAVLCHLCHMPSCHMYIGLFLGSLFLLPVLVCSCCHITICRQTGWLKHQTFIFLQVPEARSL